MRCSSAAETRIVGTVRSLSALVGGARKIELAATARTSSVMGLLPDYIKGKRADSMHETIEKGTRKARQLKQAHHNVHDGPITKRAAGSGNRSH